MTEIHRVDPYGKSQDPATAAASQLATIEATGRKHAAYRFVDNRGGVPSIRAAISLVITGVVMLVLTTAVLSRIESSSIVLVRVILSAVTWALIAAGVASLIYRIGTLSRGGK